MFSFFIESELRARACHAERRPASRCQRAPPPPGPCRLRVLSFLPLTARAVPMAPRSSHASEIYANKLTAIGNGYALYDPSPADHDGVEVGDVGYLHEGAFIRLFNIFDSHYGGVTLSSEGLDRAGTLWRRTPLAPGLYCSDSCQSNHEFRGRPDADAYVYAKSARTSYHGLRVDLSPSVRVVLWTICLLM